MRFNSSYPKALVLESEEDSKFLIDALEIVITQKETRKSVDMAELIIAWIKKD